MVRKCVHVKYVLSAHAGIYYTIQKHPYAYTHTALAVTLLNVLVKLLLSPTLALKAFQRGHAEFYSIIIALLLLHGSFSSLMGFKWGPLTKFNGTMTS